jgi:hypothetical protein
MSADLPNIPGDFPTIIADAVAVRIFKELAAYVRDEVGGLAEKYEKEWTDNLKKVRTGGDFLGLKVTRGNDPAENVVLRVELSGDVPGVPGLKIGMATAEVVIERSINLTTSGKPPVNIVGILSFAIELELSKKENYKIRLGYAQDESIASQSRIVLVSVEWKNPQFRLLGLLGQTDKGGILIDVQGESPAAVPLGASGFGLKGVGLLYGEHFAPMVNGAVAGNAMEKLASADAGAYADWAQRAKQLDTWIAVPDDINVYGISATMVDMGSSGRLVRLEQYGIAYLTYGPTLILSGDLRILEKIEGGRAIGTIDLRSRSIFARVSQRIDVIPWAPNALVAEGSVEVSASLTNDMRTFIALGGYGMDGCRITLLDFLELTGGIRVVPIHGIAARAKGRVAAEGEVAGFGGGFSFWIEVYGGIGWNPVALEARLEIGGSIWIKVFGKKLALGASVLTELYLKKPLIFRLRVDFEIKIWFATIHIPVTVFNFEDRQLESPAPALQHAAGNGVAIMHPPSGLLGTLNAKQPIIWPDTMFVLDFQRSAGASPIIVNSVSGALREAGIDVNHQFHTLVIERKDPLDGSYSALPDVRASWLLNASESGMRPSSRLAIPSNDPFGWLQHYGYRQSDAIDRIKQFRLQAFGAGPARAYEVSPSGTANAQFGEIEISWGRAFWLIPVPWANGYARALNVQGAEITFSAPTLTGRDAFDVDLCELRIVSSVYRPPQTYVRNGTAWAPKIVRLIGYGEAEWSILIERTANEAKLPLLIVDNERTNLIVAIGYRAAERVVSPVPDTQVLAPGHYRLRTKGETSASFRGNTAPATGIWNFAQEFEVVPPPLRPYLRYATLGDERIFGLDAGGWNPNPTGQGFGHYPSHLGQIRAGVGYLDKIYPTLFVSTDDASTEISVPVNDCRQGTLAGTRASQQWRTETGQPPSVEGEISFDVHEPAGLHRLTVRRIGTDGVTPGDVVDEWTYRVSSYKSAAAHLGISSVLGCAVGPFGSRGVPANPPAAIPADFDPDKVTAASINGSWTLPRLVSSFVGVGSAQAGLHFLQALEWCGIFDAPSDSLGHGPFARPDNPDLCLVMDRAAAPFGLLIRTAEPCDWRRVELVAVTRFADPEARRLAIKVIPSPDGCQCLLIMFAEGIPVRVPKGDLLLRIRFKLEADGLPRLTLAADPAKKVEEVLTAFNQPLGAAWWEK